MFLYGNSFFLSTCSRCLLLFLYAGSHWSWQMIYMVLNGRSEFMKGYANQMIEGQTPETIQRPGSPRILNTHLLPKHLPANLLTCGCKIIHIMRNPKDILVSLFHHYKSMPSVNFTCSWDSHLSLMVSDKGWCLFILCLQYQSFCAVDQVV